MRYFGFNEPSFNVKRFGFAFSRFTPAELFANGEQGVWLDPSDLSTMFQDENGSESVIKDGDPVGLVLDRSQGLALDTPLISTDSVDFESSLWAYAGSDYLVKGDTFSVYSGIAGPRLSGLVVGKVYKLVATISHTQELGIRNGGGGSSPIIAQYPSSNKRSVDLVFVASSVNAYFRLNGVGDFILHDITVAEIKGNHATQETAASRPIYRTDGNLHWLEFDGVDDYLSAQIAGLSDFSSFIAGASFTTSKAHSVIFSGWNDSSRVAYSNITMMREGASYRARSNNSNLYGPTHNPVGNVFTYVSDGSKLNLINPVTGDIVNFTPAKTYATDTLYIGSAPESHGTSAMQGKIWGVVIANGNTNKDDALQVDKILRLKAGVTL